MPKFAANLSMMFTEVPFLERFKAAKNAGFSAVEFLFPYDYPAEQLAEKLKDQSLQQVLFNTSPGDMHAGEWGLAALPGREKDARRDIDLALEYARVLGCPSIHVMAGVVPVGAAREDYQQVFVENIRYAADRFAQYDINVMIEALNPNIKPHYLFSSQYDVLDCVNLIERPNVFMQLDLFHAQIVDGNLSHLITSLAGRYGHIQIASVPNRHEPDEGEINYTYLFGLLDEINYNGWIGCEYHPRDDTLAGLGWIKPYQS
ncbi:2-oxo-tetronate isomerase [Yersinia kristensenii]|uniref:2-oxo-tetronate isomerase n=1 Tax=Yersinia kristensenii TaxID=28152 RepID=UPI00389684A9